MRKAAAGTRLHGVAEEGVPVRDIAEAIGRDTRLPVVAISGEEAADHFGFLGPIFALDAPASSALTRKRLGWDAVRPGLIPDLDEGHCFKGRAAVSGRISPGAGEAWSACPGRAHG